MRSVFVSMLALVLCVLLCACLADLPAWETVDDEVLLPAQSRRASSIVFSVPEDAVCQSLSPDGADALYEAADGSYAIITSVSQQSPETVMEALTGFCADDLSILTTTRFGLPEYQFVWSALDDEGERVYRAAMLCDELYCYTLCFSRPASAGSSYDAIQSRIFSSFGLYYDETV